MSDDLSSDSALLNAPAISAMAAATRESFKPEYVIYGTSVHQLQVGWVKPALGA
jgi:hypothetical protein